MNSYDFFVSKLKAMQIQGFSQSSILEQWNKGLPDVLNSLEQELMIAILSDKNYNKIQDQIRYVKNLNETIKNGLLE